MSIKKIGFIGLGAMGFPMAKHLLNSGFQVQVAKHSDKEKSLEKIDQLKKLGATVQDDISKVPIGVDLVISMLPSDKEVESVFLNSEIYNNMEKETIILEMTSGTPDPVIKLEEFYLNKDIKIIDAPVSGGVVGAENGKLTIFGSGDEKVFEEIKEVLNAFSGKIYYIGKLGTGKVLKSINQMMIAINAMGLVEGFSVAREQGIDLDTMYEVISESSGNSYAFNRYLKILEEENFEGGFKLSLMRKDINTALKLVDNIPLPFTNLAHDMLLMGKEYDDLNFISIRNLYKDKK